MPDGDAVIAVANDSMRQFDLVVATQDWHPSNHSSFASQHKSKKVGDVIDLNGLQQMLWPDHCVQNTKGAQFVAGLDMKNVHKVFYKGMDNGVDSYSGFFDNGHRNATGLGDFLKQQEVDEVTVTGLATDYCVKFTALDSRGLGFKTRFLLHGSRGVEISKGDCAKAAGEMMKAGVQVV